MSKIDKELLPNESILYRASYHPWAYAKAAVIFVPAIVCLCMPRWRVAGLTFLVFALGQALSIFINLRNAECVVTNRRVIVKLGWIGRRSLELFLTKVEGISVNQNLVGRLFNFGTIGVRGVGGSQEIFENIRNPLEFRRQVQAITDANEG